MDRRVKERLVGATILGVLIVLLVPEMLSGPKPTAAPTLNPTEPVRNVTVDLATRRSVSAVPPPASAAETGGAAKPETAPSGAATPMSEPPPAALETPSSSPTSTATEAPHRNWAVQIGSFASRDNADKVVRQLKARGFSVYVVSSGAGASLRHRVRVGPIADRGAAERTVSKLKALGHTASIVPPAP
jgi:cell division septation protein DedD